MWPKKKNKYNRKKVEHDGRWFDSRLEKAVYEELKLLEMAGNISDLECQVEVRLTKAGILFKPDFRFVENGVVTYGEAKGVNTQAWAIKKRLWKHYGLGPLKIWKGHYKKFYLHETVEVKESD